MLQVMIQLKNQLEEGKSRRKTGRCCPVNACGLKAPHLYLTTPGAGVGSSGMRFVRLLDGIS